MPLPDDWFRGVHGEDLTQDQWMWLMEDNSYQRVISTWIGDYWVSTIWLGMDHSHGYGPPLFFETMVFCSNEHDPKDYGGRWSTFDEAIAGHGEIVTLILSTVPGLVGSTLDPDLVELHGLGV